MESKMVDQLLQQYNAYQLFVIAKQTKKELATRIKELSALNGDSRFVSHSTKIGYSDSTLKDAKSRYAMEFAEKLDELDKMKEFWQNHHFEYYRMQPCLPTSPDLSDAINQALTEDFGIYGPGMIDTLVQSYRASNEILKVVDGPLLDMNCVELKLMLNIQHKGEYESAVDTFYRQLELPKENEWIESNYSKSEIDSYRISLTRESCKDWAQMRKLLQKLSSMVPA